MDHNECECRNPVSGAFYECDENQCCIKCGASLAPKAKRIFDWILTDIDTSFLSLEDVYQAFKARMIEELRTENIVIPVRGVPRVFTSFPGLKLADTTKDTE